MNILIAEDDAVSRRVLQRAVESRGHRCVAVADGQAAWSAYHVDEFDVVISDWMMPGLDGLELCRRVRASGEGNAARYTYFLFLTALDDLEHLVQGMTAGADHYLPKPLSLPHLDVELRVAERFTGLFAEVAAQRKEMEHLNRQLYVQARLDPMTGTGNRLRLREDLELVQARIQRDHHSFGVLLLDIDRFKRYNDHYGHVAGDDVVKRVADVLKASCRPGDAVYRYGGEEFLLILPDKSIESVLLSAERIRSSVEDLRLPHEGIRPGGQVTISVGVAVVPGARRLTFERALHEADTALYQAKEAGRNRVVVGDQFRITSA